MVMGGPQGLQAQVWGCGRAPWVCLLTLTEPQGEQKWFSSAADLHGASPPASVLDP